jgi:hypothetical protein
MKILNLLFLILVGGCVTTQQPLTRREKDQRFFIHCIKDVYNQGISEAEAHKICVDAMNQPN